MAFKAKYEQVANNARSNLNAGIDASQTTLVVDAAIAFPLDGNFRVKLETELMLVTAVSGTTFTVVRGAEGTTGAVHSAGIPVLQVVTAGGFAESMYDYLPMSRAGDAAGRPPLFSMTNDTGGVLNSGSFTWINQGTASVVNLTPHGMSFTIPQSSGASTDLRLYVRTAPSTPYTITTAISHSASGTVSNSTDIPWAGLTFREAATGKLRLVRQHPQPHTAVIPYTNETTPLSADLDVVASIDTYVHYLQIEDNGTTLFFRRSNNGILWEDLFSVARTDHFTTAPDQVGIALSGRWGSSTGIGTDHKAHVLHWSET